MITKKKKAANTPMPHSDEKEDKSLVKSMVKKTALKEKRKK